MLADNTDIPRRFESTGLVRMREELRANELPRGWAGWSVDRYRVRDRCTARQLAKLDHRPRRSVRGSRFRWTESQE